MTTGEVIGRLQTEAVRPELRDLDRLAVDELVAVMCAEATRPAEVVSAAAGSIAAAVMRIVGRLETGGRLVYVGAGTAGRLGMLDAAEAGPTFNVEDGRVVGVLAGGAGAFEAAVEDAEDDAAAGAAAVRALGVGAADAVVGVSASGRTPYVLGAIDAARAGGALTVGLSCNTSPPLSERAELAIEVPVGPEVIAGSTRLNAGTAQKIVLNIISTSSMVMLGKTYGNLMVDVRATNEKLRDRATRIVAEITGAEAAGARGALEQAGWSSKLAAVMISGGLDPAAAADVLSRHDGRLRDALESLAGNGTSAGAPRRPSTHWRRLGVAAALVDGRLVPGDVAVDGEEVAAVGLPAGRGGGSGIAAAGLVDLQVNGFAGIDALSASVDELAAMGRALLAHGIVAYQPTLISADPDLLLEQIAVITRTAALDGDRGGDGARILGVHLEGPFLSPERAGTHPLERLLAPDTGLLEKLLSAGGVTMVTLAPELAGALDLVLACRRRGVVVSLGHSLATAAQAEAAFAAGAGAVTHLFNAMGPMSSRSPGLAGAALATTGVALQLIGDGVHVADEMLRFAFAAAPERCSLVSDAVAAAGGPDSPSRLGDVAVQVKGGVARRGDGTIAGGIYGIDVGLARLARLGIGVEQAVGAVTHRPGAVLGDAGLGRLAAGARADLVVLDERLGVERILFRGREVERARTAAGAAARPAATSSPPDHGGPPGPVSSH